MGAYSFQECLYALGTFLVVISAHDISSHTEIFQNHDLDKQIWSRGEAEFLLPHIASQ